MKLLGQFPAVVLVSSLVILTTIIPRIESDSIANPTMEGNNGVKNITRATTMTTETNIRSTETSTEMAEVTTLQPPATTTSSIPPMTKLPTPKPPTLDNFYCVCDYHFNFCDLNCCCDPDCSVQEIGVFSACSAPQPSSVQVQYSCQNYDYLFRNSTPFKMTHSKDGLFCIAYDNYKGYDPLNAQKFEAGTLQKHARYKWNQLSQPLIANRGEPYKYRSTIKIVRETNSRKSVGHLDMPSAFHRQECIAREPVLFLQNTEEICFQHMTNLAHDCVALNSLNANTFLENITVIGNPAKNFSDENLITFTLMACEGSINKCKKTNVSTTDTPYFHEASGCNNVLQALDFTVVHNGTEGIKEVLAKVLLVNITTNSVIRQEFSTHFVWKDGQYEDDKNKTTFANSERIPRSGHPGYIFGKPIVMGIKVRRDQMEGAIGLKKTAIPGESKQTTENGSAGKPKEEIMLLNYDSSKWMTVFGPGECKNNNRKPVLFGRTILTACTMNVSEFKTCRGLQHSIETILLGIPIANFTNRYVSSFGNPKFDNIKDWIPLQTSDPPISTNLHSLVKHGCDGIKASLRIQIAYANVGPVDNPQPAIYGVIYQFGASNKLPNETTRAGETLISISTTVGFADLTIHPVSKIAEWPTVSIQLPPDFFYPFTWSSGSPRRHNNRKICMWIIPLFALFLY